MSSIFNSIRYLILWITINKYYIVTWIFIIRIIALIIFSPLLSGFNMLPEFNAALLSSLHTELHMYMQGHLYPVDLEGDSPEYNWPIQLEARIYDPIREEFVEDGPSYTPPFQQPNPGPPRIVIPKPNPVELPVGHPKPEAMEPPIQPPKPDLPVMKPPVGEPKLPTTEPPIQQPNPYPVRPPVVEQPNVQPVRPPVVEQLVRPPGPEQPNIGYHKYKLPVSEEQRVELGEGSNSNAASSKITLPIELEALSTEQRNFAANYWEKQSLYQEVMNEIRKAKNIPATWRELEPELTRKREDLWREIVELRVYASNNYDLQKVGDIRDLVAVVTGNRFR